jgi:hypothetical protein
MNTKRLLFVKGQNDDAHSGYQKWSVHWNMNYNHPVKGLRSRDLILFELYISHHMNLKTYSFIFFKIYIIITNRVQLFEERRAPIYGGWWIKFIWRKAL